MTRTTAGALLCTLLLCVSCADIYYSPNARTIAAGHETIAILPPKVSIAAQRKVDAEAIKEQQKTESINLQQEMYTWLLRRKMQQRISVDLQDVETTNAKLREIGYYESNTNSPAELAEILGVDAVMYSNYALSKPISTGGAIALAVIAGFGGPTNEAAVTLKITDRTTKEMIWSFNHTIQGSLGSSPNQLVNALMRQASTKMPYYNRS